MGKLAAPGAGGGEVKPFLLALCGVGLSYGLAAMVRAVPPTPGQFLSGVFLASFAWLVFACMLGIAPNEANPPVDRKVSSARGHNES